jgi:hypothetical protein
VKISELGIGDPANTIEVLLYNKITVEVFGKGKQYCQVIEVDPNE